MKKLFLAKLGAAAAAGGSSAATGGAAAGGAAAGGAAAGGAAAGGLAAGGAGTAVPLGLGALATKAITVTAATVVLAGGAVEVHRIATPHREAPRPAVAQPGPEPELAPDATGPVSPVPLVENKDEATPQDAAKTKDDQKKNGDPSNTASEKPLAPPEDQSALSPTGTTDPAVPTDGSEIAPVEGQSAPPPDAAQTGGAALPPSEPQSEPAAGGNQAPPK